MSGDTTPETNARPPDADGDPWFAAFVRPDGYVPLTERILPQRGVARVAGVLVFAALPVVHLVTFSALGLAAGLATLGPHALAQGLQGRLLNAYLTVITIWTAAHVASKLREIRALPGERSGLPADWRTWLLPPLLLVVAFSLGQLGGNLEEFGAQTVSEKPAPFLVGVLIAALIRIPQATAFWTVVVALVAIGRMRRLPGTFPEDRSLGLRPVGELLTSILLLFAAAFVPSFVFGTSRLSDLVSIVLIFFLGGGVLLLAVWRLHRSMAAERQAAVDAARARYADVYRATMAGEPAPDAPSMSTVDSLVKGAESIHEWPFDDRMQRVAAVVVGGVITGMTVRLILYGLGI